MANKIKLSYFMTKGIEKDRLKETLGKEGRIFRDGSIKLRASFPKRHAANEKGYWNIENRIGNWTARFLCRLKELLY